MTGLFVWLALQGDDVGLPPTERLRTVEGTVRSTELSKGDTAIYLEGDPQKYWYLGKAGNASHVASEVTRGRTVRLTVDAEDLDDKTRKYVGVFAVTVDGRVIRSFEEVSEDWRANNRFGYVLIAVFGPIGVLATVTAWRLFRSRKRSLEEEAMARLEDL